jgi:hypothetical protein
MIVAAAAVGRSCLLLFFSVSLSVSAARSLLSEREQSKALALKLAAQADTANKRAAAAREEVVTGIPLF